MWKWCAYLRRVDKTAKFSSSTAGSEEAILKNQDVAVLASCLVIRM